MADYAPHHEIEPVVAAAHQWKQSCLLRQGSLFSNESIWTAKNASEIDKYFVQNPDEADEKFILKLEKQLKPAGAGAKKLAAEMTWVLRLFGSDIKLQTKVTEIQRIWRWSGEELPGSHPLLSEDALGGIGGTGVGFKFQFWKELVYFVELLTAWTKIADSQKEALLADPWQFSDWLAALPGGEKRFLRHMLCYLLFPKSFERIVSRNHKIDIAKAFSPEIGADPDDVDDLSPTALDKRLLSIREKLERDFPNQKLDFYYVPLRSRWMDDENVVDPAYASNHGVPSASTHLHDAFDAFLTEYPEAKKEPYSGSHKVISRFRSLENGLSSTVSEIAPDVSIKWSVGKGNWAGVPWIAFLHNGITSSTVSGVYPVILFRADLSGFYLTLNQGVTKPNNELGSEKAKEFITQTAEGIRHHCSSLRSAGFVLDNAVDLRSEKGTLGSEYAFSTIAHKFYGRDRLPNDAEFKKDLGQLLRVYNAYATGRIKRPDAPVVLLSKIHEAFSAAVTAAGVKFGARHSELTRSFLASLATKRFVILTGLSGSGKTQLALKFGEWLCPNDRTDIVPVRPDWTGPEAILGYEDALHPPVAGKRPWHVPRALELILKAANDPDRPYLLILDEMNLAHVERYFADLLSGMESGATCIPNLEKKSENWIIAPGSKTQGVPDNLFVIGTVNVDETTYMFSPKVLDRANTLEFRVHHDDLQGAGTKPRSCGPADESFASSFLAIARSADWHNKNEPQWASSFRDELRALHKVLGEGGFEFGHRVFFEACRFAAIHNAAGGRSAESALDLQVMQKVLPRIHGSRRQLEGTLTSLAKFCYGPIQGDVIDLAKMEPTSARLPISFAKARRMLIGLKVNQFTSFTDA